MARRPRKPKTVFRKRRNVGLPKLSDRNLDRPTNPNQTPMPTSSMPQPISTSNISEPESASKKKLGDLNVKYNAYSKDSNVNIIVDLDILSSALSNFVKCSNCDSAEIEVRNLSNVGLASKLSIYCRNCMESYPFMSSKKHEKKNMYHINTRLVYGLRAIGKGLGAAKTLCGVMNLPPPVTRFLPYVESIGDCAEDVCHKAMKTAVDDAVSLNDGVRDIPVAIDGTWQKRGFTSLNGVITATSFDTGLVIDVAILSKFCTCPDKASGNHLFSCKANYSGASGGMEVKGVREIFGRSLEVYNVRYTQYLGDGDSKGFGAIEEMSPYGDECPVTKLECIGHIQKRMGTRLRKLKNENKNIKLADGKGLGGQNRLSAAVIDQIQNYYGKAIRSNTESVQKMKNAIWALFFHKISTDDEPQHALCPKGEGSWCKYQQSLITKTPYTHKHSIPVPIMTFIKPVFQSLAAPELLKKCLHGHTQNPNESVNNVIWSRLPKTGFVGIKTLHLGVYDAVSTFNCGQIVRCQVLQMLGINVGKYTAEAMKELDKLRLRDSIRAASELRKKARQKKRMAKRKLEDKEEDPDNPSYGAGMF